MNKWPVTSLATSIHFLPTCVSPVGLRSRVCIVCVRSRTGRWCVRACLLRSVVRLGPSREAIETGTFGSTPKTGTFGCVRQSSCWSFTWLESSCLRPPRFYCSYFILLVLQPFVPASLLFGTYIGTCMYICDVVRLILFSVCIRDLRASYIGIKLLWRKFVKENTLTDRRVYL
jgi:hypothetical protein